VGPNSAPTWVPFTCRFPVLGIAAKDLDIEVYGIEPAELVPLLAEHFRLDLVGQAFGVLKLHDYAIDISIPRRESKAGLGHKGFDILSDPRMAPEEAASRRDFTINSMALDPMSGELVDPFGGMRDIRARVLRHTSPKFAEDPLRVLRGMQFAARFQLAVAPETVALCREIEPEGLAPERIFEEWKKLLLLGVRPSIGLEFLRACGWIQVFPELQALVGCPQELEWHPEGDVWTHTLHCLDGFAHERLGDEWEDLVVGLAILCHDTGKPSTTKNENGRIRTIGHEAAGEPPTRSFLARMTHQTDLIEAVVGLVVPHLRPKELFDAKVGNAAVRRLARRVGRIDRLVRVARADQMGRPPVEFDGFPAGEWLLNKARCLDVEKAAPRPIVMGRHLIELGLTPGPDFGRILGRCYDAQIEGEFSTLEAGIEYAQTLIDEAGE
jgi:tRNA nucleotidyltransferase (CCA-adding enzyme)